MPLAHDRLEILQIRKLSQCVRTSDKAQIAKLVEHGIPGLIDYQGEQDLCPQVCVTVLLSINIVLQSTYRNYLFLMNLLCSQTAICNSGRDSAALCVLWYGLLQNM